LISFSSLVFSSHFFLPADCGLLSKQIFPFVDRS
jgi:hypothetical protein